MTAPMAFPRRRVVDMFLGDRWRPVSTDVRQKPSMSITQGRKDEATRLTPCKCTFVLDDGPEHGDGDYNPENAAGQWYGQIGRNTPVRVALAYGEDAFDRVSVSGWGSAPAMGAWSTFTGAGTLASDINANQARHQITATASFIAHYLPSVSIRDVDVSVETNLQSATTVTGGALEIANLLARGQSTTNYYMLRVSITTAQRLTMQLMQGNSSTLVAAIDCGPYNGLASPLGVRFQLEGNTFRGKVWETASGEPIGWDLEYTATTTLAAGWVGVRSGVGGGNSNVKPISFLYNNFTVQLPRFAGYTAKMVPTTTLDHKAPTVSVDAAGLLRIVQQGKRAIGTPISRYLDSGAVDVIDHWPLDEGPEASQLGANRVPGGANALFRRETSNPLAPKGAIKWGATAGLSSTGPAIELTQGGYLTLPVRSDRIGLQWSASWLQKISADSGGSCWLRTGQTIGNGDISFVWYTDGSYEVYLIGSPDILLHSGSFTRYGFDDVWHSIKFTSSWAGATDTVFLLSIDDRAPTGATWSPVTYRPILRFEAQAEPTSTEPASYAQVIIVTDSIADLAPDPLGTTTTVAFGLDQGYRGWPEEPAAARFARLCAEQGVPYAMVGDPAVSPLMGPQRDASLTELLQECVDVEQGSMFEPKGSPALGLITTRAMIDKAPALTLDYSAKQVAEPFGPTRDDQGIVNDVTAKRPGGGQYRVEKTTGPLNVNDPGTAPGAVGRYDKTVTVNVLTDDGLRDQAGWRVHMGTVDEPRYPTIAVDLAAAAFNPNLAGTLDVLDVGVDDVVYVTNAQARNIFETVRQVARGWTETLDTAYQHTIKFNTTPASVYDAFKLDDSDARFDSDTSYLTNAFTVGSTSMQVTTSGDTRWTTTPAHFPFTVRAGGVLLTVTNITGTGATQTFTVSATPANGVTKTIPANTPVTYGSRGYLIPGEGSSIMAGFTAGAPITAQLFNNAFPPMQDHAPLDSGTVTSTGYTQTRSGATSPVGKAFVAPTSGKVSIDWHCAMRTASGTNIPLVAIGVRNGSSVGAGTDVLTASDNVALQAIPSTADVHMGMSHALSGLTPGANYNVTLWFRVNGGTGTFSRCAVKVNPEP